MMWFVEFYVSQNMTAVRIVDGNGARIWRGQCLSTPDKIDTVIRQHASADARLRIETGPRMTWLVHSAGGLRKI